MKIYTKVTDDGTFIYLHTGKSWHNGPICIGTIHDVGALHKAYSDFIVMLDDSKKLLAEFKSKADIKTQIFFMSVVRENMTLVDAYEAFKTDKHVEMIPFAEFEILFNDYKKYITL